MRRDWSIRLLKSARLRPNWTAAASAQDLMEVFSRYGGQAVGQFDVGGALTAVTRIMHEYNLFMPSRVSMLIKCLILLEGTAKGLNASFNLAELLEPYRRQFMLQQLSPATWMRKAKRLGRDWESLATSTPRDLKNLLKQLQSGHFAVRIKHQPLEKSVNRMVYGMCMSTFLLASALLWIHAVPPTIHGMSLLGAMGYLIAAFLTARLLWSISSERRKEN